MTLGQLAADDGVPPSRGVGTSQAALEATGLVKRFGATLALDNLTLRVDPGEVRALLGENGSGKSTLIKILSGYHVPDAGTVRVRGSELATGSPDSSAALGLRFVHQNLGLVRSLTVAENLCLAGGYAMRFGTIQERRTRAIVREELARLGLDLDPRRRVDELSPAEQTGVATARALRGITSQGPSGGAAVLVLDEPTANLPEGEVIRLLDIVRSVAASGTAVIYVTHRLEEVTAIADSVTILRDGHEVLTTGGSVNQRSILHHMLGMELEEADARATPAPRSSNGTSGPLLSVDGLVGERLGGISLQVAPGEIVGVSGITGSGREEIAAAVFGAVDRLGGRVVIGGQVVKPRRPDLAIAAGAAFVPASRERGGGFMELSGRENLSIGRISAFWRWPSLRLAKERANARDWFDRLHVRPAGAQESPLSAFSGGNQQKIVFAKWLQREPQVFLLEEPTQGVDVSTKAFLHQQLRDAAAAGAAILISSSDNEELVSLCHRVLVLRYGRIGAELRGEELTNAQLSFHSLGLAKETSDHGA
jgi:ribose transport system ATP-binding protein